MIDSNYINIETRTYVDREIKHLSDKITIENSKNQEALKDARVEMNRRLEGMNEFRTQLSNQAKTFIGRDEFSATEKLINQKIESMQKLLYIGLGIFLVIQVVFATAISLIFK